MLYNMTFSKETFINFSNLCIHAIIHTYALNAIIVVG